MKTLTKPRSSSFETWKKHRHFFLPFILITYALCQYHYSDPPGPTASRTTKGVSLNKNELDGKMGIFQFGTQAERGACHAFFHATYPPLKAHLPP